MLMFMGVVVDFLVKLSVFLFCVVVGKVMVLFVSILVISNIVIL